MTQDPPLALLPMYDWPEVRAETDVYWRALRDACLRRGFAAPERLSRPDALRENWTLQCWLNPNLLLGQTCGLPFARHLQGKVQLLGSPVYSIDGCDPGDYYSLIIAAKDGGIANPDDISQTHRFAFNSEGSQSGFRVMRLFLEARGRPWQWLESGVVSGSHRHSIQAVGEGRADFAAIDAVSWILAKRFEPQIHNVVVIGRTATTPGLPMITACGRDPDLLREVIEEAIAGLDSATAGSLGLIGFRRRGEEDYAGFSGD